MVEYDFSEVLGPYAIGGVCGTFVYILLIIGMWKVFTKMGEPGWKALIPVYNFYILYKYGWSGKAFVGILIAAVCYVLLQYTPAYQNGSGFIDLLLKLISFIIGVIGFILNIKLAKRFGKGFLFGIGLWILTPIFMLILGCGSSRYRWNE